MNNNITEDDCSFEVSTLLKEKGFQVSTSRYYKPDGTFVVNFEESHGESEYRFDADDFFDNWNDGRVVDNKNGSCWGCGNRGSYFPPVSLPTHALAIKWLRVNFGIHISVDFDSKNWFAVITILPNKDRHIYGSSDSPEQATEAALLYTLKNLI